MNTQRKRKSCARITKEAVVGSIVVEADAPKVAGVAKLAANEKTIVSAVPAGSVITGAFVVCKNPDADTAFELRVGTAVVTTPVGAVVVDGTATLVASFGDVRPYIEETTDVTIINGGELLRGTIEVFVEFYELSATNGTRVQP